MAKRKMQKLLAFCLAVSMLMGTTAMAAEPTKGTVAVETRGGKKEAVNVVISVEKDGKTTKKTETAENFVTESGMIVDYKGSSEMNDDGTGTAQSEYTSEKGDYSAEGGSEITAEKKPLQNITVDVPMTSENGKNQNTVTGDKAGTILEVTGDEKAAERDGEYDYTQTVIKEQGSVSADTKEITITETILPKEESKTDLDYTFGTETTGKEKDLFTWVFKGNRTELPKEGEEIDVAEGFDYKYIGSGNSSQIFPTFLFTTPETEGEEPVYVDANGKAYYKHSYGCLTSEDYYYRNGERYEIEGTFPSIFSVPQQFILVDGATGELITTYCADFETSTVKGFNYNIENLEDADYYNEEQAAMIRTITENGYWGVVGTETDEEGNEVPAEGSLAAMKENLLASGKFTEEELQYLTEGVALTATQMSIWTFSNEMSGVEYFSAIHSKDSNSNNEIATSYAGPLCRTDADNLSEDEKKSVDVLYKLYDYLINLEPTAYENPTTQDTIINADNFLKDLNVTVVDKIKDHENNQDEDDTNDAYTTNISFALVVTPSTENGDDLVVKVLDKNGNPIAEGRVAGVNDENENYLDLSKDENDNYVFTGVPLIEGDQNFRITIEGVQNLKEGVYLYTSEVAPYDGDKNGVIEEENKYGVNETETTSQTLVGKASGKRDVNVEMNIRFELNVDDEVVAKERYWRSEEFDDGDDDDDDIVPPGDDDDDDDDDTEIGDDDVPKGEFPGDDDDDTEEIPEEDVPLEEMPDEDVPLADVPKTGDVSVLWFALSALSGAGLVGLNLTGKKREDEE